MARTAASTDQSYLPKLQVPVAHTESTMAAKEILPSQTIPAASNSNSQPVSRLKHPDSYTSVLAAGVTHLSHLFPQRWSGQCTFPHEREYVRHPVNHKKLSAPHPLQIRKVFTPAPLDSRSIPPVVQSNT